MQRFLLLTLFVLTFIGCGDGRVDLITRDVISDVASCYQNMEATESSYLISVEKDCVDTLLPDTTVEETDPDIPTVNVVYPTTTHLNPNNDWELIATLERDPLNPDEFYVPTGKVAHLPNLTDTLTDPFAEGKDFIFVVNEVNEAVRNNIHQRQFYLLQPEKPVYVRPYAARPNEVEPQLFWYQFPSPPNWYSVPQGLYKTDTTYMGLSVEFDILTVDEVDARNPLRNPPDRKYMNPPRFFVSNNWSGRDIGIIHRHVHLKIYVSKE